MNQMSVKKRNSSLLVGLAMLATLLIAGCSTIQIGRDFDVTAFEANAVIGKTTKAQVIQILGSPASKGIKREKDGERFDEWVYFSGSGKMPAMKDTRIKILQMHFDKNDVLQSYNWSASNN